MEAFPPSSEQLTWQEEVIYKGGYWGREVGRGLSREWQEWQ